MDELLLDPNNSLVTEKARLWYVAFVPPLDKRWWHRYFHPKHKHVFAMTYLEGGRWLLVEPWWTRMWVTVLDKAGADKFFRWGRRGDALFVREEVPGRSSQIRGWMTCAVLVAHLLGRSYWVWTPHQLYNKLKAEN